MGISVNGVNANYNNVSKPTADNYEKFTVGVTKALYEQGKPLNEITDSFTFSSNGTDESYKNDLDEFAKDYIKIYDKNGDGKISFDEYEAFELKQTKENIGDEIDENILQSALEELKTTFSRLNVNDTNDSKDVLDKDEIMNFFTSMDSIFGKDGKISASEYLSMEMLLSNKDDDTVDKFLKINYKNLVNNTGK